MKKKIPTRWVSQLSGCCPPYGYHFSMTIRSDYFSLSTVYILTKDNMIDMPKNNVSRLLGLIPSSSIRIAVFHKDIAADIEMPKEIKTSSTLLL